MLDYPKFSRNGSKFKKISHETSSLEEPYKAKHQDWLKQQQQKR